MHRLDLATHCRHRHAPPSSAVFDCGAFPGQLFGSVSESSGPKPHSGWLGWRAQICAGCGALSGMQDGL